MCILYVNEKKLKFINFVQNTLNLIFLTSQDLKKHLNFNSHFNGKFNRINSFYESLEISYFLILNSKRISLQDLSLHLKTTNMIDKIFLFQSGNFIKITKIN